ncbi:MAG TPA: diphthine--ammonia ligase [Flavisolibacter sp.]|nr:diphthine--ammonia ligase [Flavisolibacter sp.]
MQAALVSWSGGKDSCYAAYKALQQGVQPKVLLNVLNEEGQISRSHGIPSLILQAQARAMGLPIHLIASSWQEYEHHFTNALSQLKQQYDLTHAIFGDIDLDGHREWEEKVCTKADLTATLPIWQRNRKELVLEMLQWGLQTIIVSCNEVMGPAYLGKTLTLELVDELEALGVDPCGENGEFHTLVVNCPLFKAPLKVTTSGQVQHSNYWFTTLHLES